MKIQNKQTNEIVDLGEVGTIGDKPYGKIYFKDGSSSIIPFNKISEEYKIL